MSARADELVAKLDHLNDELLSMLSGLTEEDLRTPCDDEGGATVGEVVLHLGEGAPQVLGWLAAISGGAPAAAPDHHDHGHGHDHGHEHGHEHDHGHGHENGPAPAGRVEQIDRLETALRSSSQTLRLLTAEQLDSVPPPQPGITDGTRPLHVIVDTMIDHQLQHLEYMRKSLTGR